MTTPTHFITTLLASFSASLVEFVEALTIVLAVGVSRNWKSSLSGAATGVVALTILVLACGPLFLQKFIPITILQIIIGLLLLLFGLRWLRKAVLRAAGIIPLHDEAQSYEKQIRKMDAASVAMNAFDIIALAASFKAVLIEGIEVVFIVVAMSAAESNFLPASIGAATALLLVVLTGAILHRPLTRIPENTLKFGVAVILTSFGLFWIGEGLGFNWPGEDLAIPALIFFILVISLLIVGLLRHHDDAK